MSATEPSQPAPLPGPKPKLTKKAQARIDRDFEALMAAKKAAEEAQRAKAVAVRQKASCGDLDNQIKISARPVLKPKKQRDVVGEIREALRSATLLIEDRPTTIPSSTSALINDAIRLGAQAFEENTSPDSENGFIVGFDLGTSSLKVAIRQPYTAGDPVVALKAPVELRSSGHPFLWQTVVWFQPESGKLTLLPEPGAVALAGFKTGVIGGKGTARISPEIDVSRSEATVAFMAMQLAYVMGWYQSERPLGQVGGDWFLSVNVGIPVAGLDDKNTLETFTRIAAAAVELAPRASDLQLNDVRDTLRRSVPVLPTGFKLVPELVAAIAGYATAPTSREGAHILVDVGASTLDIVAFNFIERTRVSVFTAGVELLGASALEYSRQAGIPDTDFKKGCDKLFEDVYGLAKRPNRAPSLFHPTFRRQDVQLLTTGGGCQSNVHSKFIGEMPKPGVLGELPVVRPVPPIWMTDLECDHSRLLLAYGLTRDDFEIVDLRRPSEIPDLTSLNGELPAYLSPEQTYD